MYSGLGPVGGGGMPVRAVAGCAPPQAAATFAALADGTGISVAVAASAAAEADGLTSDGFGIASSSAAEAGGLRDDGFGILPLPATADGFGDGE